MIKNKWVDYGVIILLVVLLIAMFSLARTIKSEGTACYSAPLQYAAKKFGEANNATFIGSAYFLKEGTPTIYFNAENISVVYPNAPTPLFFSPNLSIR